MAFFEFEFGGIHHVTPIRILGTLDQLSPSLALTFLRWKQNLIEMDFRVITYILAIYSKTRLFESWWNWWELIVLRRCVKSNEDSFVFRVGCCLSMSEFFDRWRNKKKKEKWKESRVQVRVQHSLHSQALIMRLSSLLDLEFLACFVHMNYERRELMF